MTIPADTTRVDRRWAAPRRWPTGAKLFLTLSLALLPLAIIATLATWQTARSFNDEARARLRTAAASGARALDVELVGDMTALSAATRALDRDPKDAPSCARVQGVFAAQMPGSVLFQILDRNGRLLCGTRFDQVAYTRPSPHRPIAAAVLPGRGLMLRIGGGRRHASASAFFAAGYLSDVAHPKGLGLGYGTEIQNGAGALVMTSIPSTGAMDRRETVHTPLGIDSLSLVMEMRKAPITWPLALALLLPVMMWAAAASIAWFVVDRLLVRPLRRLRASVAAYHPGDVIDPGDLRLLPAQEIVDLGDTFRAISRTVALHEAGLAEGLVRQTRLTREVHHRVKNNLQVISSLISIHARGSRGSEAAAAYSSIQRRVDALAVVHRNHFAENEANRGLPLRSVLGELASNIRATAPEESAHFGITLDIEPYFVSQDVAVAVAFLVTELVELAMSIDPVAQVRVALKPAEVAEKGRLSVTAIALTGHSHLTEALTKRYGRVIEGLARQLRAPLVHDADGGRYQVDIAVVGRD